MPMEKEELMLLGRMDGKLDSISAHLDRQDKRIAELDQRVDGRLNGIDKRLRVVEQKAAVTGAISGSAVSSGIALAIEGVKQWLSRGGSNP